MAACSWVFDQFALAAMASKDGSPALAGAFQDHMRLRILKGRSMNRVAHLVVSVMSRRPIRWMAPTARLRSAAMTRGPEPVRAVELSSR